jgi:hypothetical protein
VRASGYTLTISSIVPSHTVEDDIFNFFLDRGDYIGGAVVILDQTFANTRPSLTPSLFVAMLDVPYHRPNYQNILRSAYTRSLRVFFGLSERFKIGAQRKALTLPKRNFQAPELGEIFRLLGEGDVSAEMLDQVDRELGKIRTRQSPKRADDYSDTYLVDDASKFFQLGKERHAQAETGCPPHSLSCVMAAKFRFGQRLDAKQHYNVSVDGDNIGGVFENCHGHPEIIKPQTHINMFPSDYFT